MPIELNEQEIRHRLQELRNFEQLYPKARERIRLLEQNSYEKDRLIKKQEQIIKLLTQAQEQFKLRIEQLEIMVFGKKKDKDKKDNGKGQNSNKGKSLWLKLFSHGKKERSPDSYRRQPPAEDEITDRKNYSIETCPDCQTELTDFKLAVRYLEDIKILEKALKETTEQKIQTGFCPHCKKRFSAIPVSKQTVSLGENTKQFVCYCIVILRESFEQTRNLLKDIFGVNISDGEISGILENQSKKLLPEYNQLKINIRGSPACHYDETTYKVQKEEQGMFAWVATGSDATDTVFDLGKTRGKGNAEKLKGENTDQVGVSDDYGAYKKLFKNHQLCWAHLLRNFRDLATSEELESEKHEQCQKTYHRLASLYQNLKQELIQPFDIEKRTIVKDKFVKRIEDISKIKINSNEPQKLKTLKQTLFKNKDKYFTCLVFKNIPTTNNKAERSLRHLVLKRKSSFGSKTQRGADTMSVLFSVLLSLWWKKPDNFFQEYSKMLNRA